MQNTTNQDTTANIANPYTPVSSTVETVCNLSGVRRPVDIWQWSKPNPNVPAFEEYIFRRDLTRDYLAWLEMGAGDSFYIWGPKGSGKTSFPIQLANRLGRPVPWPATL